MKYADLHLHTKFSDGDFTPEELVTLAVEKNVRVIAITDHDTIKGIKPAIEAANHKEITIIPGVEVSIAFKREYFVGTLHLLVYFSKELFINKTFSEELENILGLGRGDSLMNLRVDAINDEFGPAGREKILTEKLCSEDVLKFGSNVTRRHFSNALKDKYNLTDNTIFKIINNDSPAYIPSGIELKKFKIISDKYSVIKILAHPAAGSFPSGHYKEVLPPLEIVMKILPEFENPDICGIDGMEVFYPGHTEEYKIFLLKLCKDKNILISGGSDCHDSVKRPPFIEGLSKLLTKNFLDLLTKKVSHKNTALK